MEFKVILLAFKALNDMAPEYVKDMLNIQRGRCALRSIKVYHVDDSKNKIQNTSR